MHKKNNQKALSIDKGKNANKISIKNNIEVNKITIQRLCLFCGILSFCMYANTLRNEYVLDDKFIILKNDIVQKGIAGIPEILYTPYWYGYIQNKEDIEEYRPIPLIMFAIEYQLFPDNPMPGHFINVIIYAACVVMMFLFLHQLFKKKRIFIAFVATLLFSIHPVHTEVVANIKSRDELLCFLFFMLSAIMAIRYFDTDKKKLLIFGLLFYFLSLLSKETSITGVALFPLIFLFYINGNWKRAVFTSLLFLLPALLYLGSRYAVFSTFYANAKPHWDFYFNPLVSPPSFASGLATKILILGYYIKLLIFPYPLVWDYSYNVFPFVSFANAGVWLSLVIYLLMLFFCISRMIKIKEFLFNRQNDPLLFGIMFYLIAIALFSNIFVLIGTEMAERFLFLPSIGFCVMFSSGIEKVIFRKEVSEFTALTNKKVMLFLIPVFIVLIVLSIQRNSEWKDAYTLDKADAEKMPNNFKLHYFLATEIELKNKEESNLAAKHDLLLQGISEYQKSLAIYPGFKQAHLNISYDFVETKQLDSAEIHANKALMLNPNDTIVLNIMAYIYCLEQKYPEAMECYRKATIIAPKNSDYAKGTGFCFLHLKAFDSAVYYFNKSLYLNPANVETNKYTAIAFFASGQIDSARKYELVVKRYEPGFSIDRIPVSK